MSSEERRFSVTLSEDDLRPHMRKKKTKKEESEIAKLTEKFEKREEKKEEVRKKIEEEERKKEEDRRREKMRQEFDELWRGTQNNRIEGTPDDRTGMKTGYTTEGPISSIPNRRRFNNSRYFNWDSDEEIIPDVPKPRSRQEVRLETFGPIYPSNDNCELCQLAHQSIHKTSTDSKLSGKSAACAHVDQFLASSSHHF